MSTVDIIFAPRFNGIIYVSSKDKKTQIAYDVDFAVRATFCYNYCGCDGGDEKLWEGAEWGKAGKDQKVEQWREGKFWNMENTLWCTFEKIAKQFGKIDLVIIENGHYRYIHLLPDELIYTVKYLNPNELLTVHHSKYAISK